MPIRGHLIGAIALAITSALSAAVASGQSPVIRIDASVRGATVDNLLFGGNHRYALFGSGSADPDTGITFKSFTDQLNAIGLNFIRYPGGVVASTFQFTRAIGPQDQRQNQVSGSPFAPLPIDSTFGPDEFGAMLNAVDGTGSLMVNFVTQSAQGAANFVQYMAGKAGHKGSDVVNWANVRAENGHHKPYSISYAEIGNEMSFWSILGGWMTGTPVTYANPSCAAGQNGACLYAFGGTTAFTGQRLGQPDDWRPPAGVSSGALNATFVLRYAPVNAAMTTVFVNGIAWTQVPTLSAAGAQNVYMLNTETGEVSFGDGVHGNVPPAGAVLTADYQSGPHDGFVDFYREIKKVAPEVKVCSSMDTAEFMQDMGSTYPYDCMVTHPYVAVPVPTTSDQKDHALSLLAAANNNRQTIANFRALLNQYSGENGPKIEILLTEYGLIAPGTPTPAQIELMFSTASGLIEAKNLLIWMTNKASANIGGAQHSTLVDYYWSAPPVNIMVSAVGQEMFTGPGPNIVAEPTAVAMGLMNQLLGHEVIGSSIDNNPIQTFSTGTLATLDAMATRDSKGNIYVTVINQNLTDPVTASVQGIASGTEAEFWVMSGPSFLSTNTPDAPNTVRVTSDTAEVSSGTFNWTFQPSSVTIIKLSMKGKGH
jgi:alpha-N-arabinofuranosidase